MKADRRILNDGFSIGGLNGFPVASGSYYVLHVDIVSYHRDTEYTVPRHRPPQVITLEMQLLVLVVC